MSSSIGYWRGAARECIEHEIQQATADGIGCSLEDTIKRIDAAYPFGERRYYPYKAWLQERRIAILLLRGIVNDPEEAEEVLAIPQHLKQVAEIDDWLKRQGVA